MADFDHQALETIKKLCKLECSAEENEDVLSSLSRILNYVEQLNEVDTQNVKTCRSVLRGMSKRDLRQDVVSTPLPREAFLANAPDQIGGMIRVPPILKSSE